jgi:hypothetical protein
VGVLEGGQHHRAAEIDNPGGGPACAVHVVHASHSGDATVCDGDRIGRSPGGIAGMDHGISQDQVGRHPADATDGGPVMFKPGGGNADESSGHVRIRIPA